MPKQGNTVRHAQPRQAWLGFFMRRPFKITFLLLLALLLTVKSEALRIISLSPSNTELLFALGAENDIVGVSTWCDYPPEAKSIPKVGDFSNVSIEKIIALNPDIVITSGYEQSYIAQEIRTLGIPVEVVEPRTFDELYKGINLLGTITGKSESANRLISEMQTALARLKSALPAPDHRPTIFIEIYARPLMTASTGSFLNEAIEIAGFKNIFPDLPRPYCQVSLEEVVAQNPDWLLILDMDTTGSVLERPGWQLITAVKEGCIIDSVNPDLLLRPGPRIVQGIRKLSKIRESMHEKTNSGN